MTSLKCIKSIALLTYLLGSENHIRVLYMLFSVFSSVCLFSYTVLCELRSFIVSEFGFGVWNDTMAPATMEYLPILLDKYPGIYFLELTRVFMVFM